LAEIQPCPERDGPALAGTQGQHVTGYRAQMQQVSHLPKAVPGTSVRSASRRRVSTRREPIKLSILMPAYNEERTIGRVIEEILIGDYPCEIELIIVDDGSTDRTPVLLAELAKIGDNRVIIYSHPTNLGKGAALRTAAALATGTHVLPFDADFEYEPEDIPRVLEPILKGRCDVVYGVRLFGNNTVYRSYRYAVGNRVLTRVTNILFDSYLSDLHTCLKLMPLSMLKRMTLTETGFGLDTEITALLLKQGVRPFEVPVSYYSRSHAEGKKITWRDAVVCLRILVRERLARRRRSEDLIWVAGNAEPGYVRALPSNSDDGEFGELAAATTPLS
jgi:dolichol-phosphate hexosyltransferase